MNDDDLVELNETGIAGVRANQAKSCKTFGNYLSSVTCILITHNLQKNVLNIATYPIALFVLNVIDVNVV